MSPEAGAAITVKDHDRRTEGGGGDGKHRLRVLIVDDSAFMRRAVERMISESPLLEVVGSATNGKDAVELTCELLPDVIVMDVNMPTMNGLEALERIMKIRPTPVLMMSTLTQEGAEITVRALELGAVDFVDKTVAGTSMDIYSLAPVLRDKVLTVARAEVGSGAKETERDAEPPSPAERARTPLSVVEIVAIGASTGGPRALTEILPRLPLELGAPIVIAQHMPPGFTATLAERLDHRCPLHVVEARNGDVLEAGTAYIAPGGMQMEVVRVGSQRVVRITPGTSALLHHPSVDLLFDSVAAAVGSRSIGIVLTGMGQDGASGLAALRAAGARTIVESEKTAIIDGMPRAARPSAEFILHLERIAPVIIELCTDEVRTVGREG
jgi:two-component system, chemotaxis family, protein-glutamate methylesterase/glutaminase